MTSQLEKDLLKRTEERLLLLCKDTFALYEMAGLGEHEAIGALAMVLLRETAKVMTISEASPEDTAKILWIMMNQEQRKLREEENAQH